MDPFYRFGGPWQPCYTRAMAILFRIIVGVLIDLVGLFFIFRSETLLDFLGPIDMIDAKLGGGGTRLFYKIVGTVIVIAGFLYMTNLWDAFLGATLGSLFPKRI